MWEHYLIRAGWLWNIQYSIDIAWDHFWKVFAIVLDVIMNMYNSPLDFENTTLAVSD